MAFEGLSGKLSAVFKKMRNKGKLKESDIKEFRVDTFVMGND